MIFLLDLAGIARSSNGRTGAFEASNEGPIPSLAAKVFINWQSLKLSVIDKQDTLQEDRDEREGYQEYSLPSYPGKQIALGKKDQRCL